MAVGLVSGLAVTSDSLPVHIHFTTVLGCTDLTASAGEGYLHMLLDCCHFWGDGPGGFLQCRPVHPIGQLPREQMRGCSVPQSASELAHLDQVLLSPTFRAVKAARNGIRSSILEQVFGEIDTGC